MTKYTICVAIFILGCVIPGSLARVCYVGQDSQTGWLANWNPCFDNCDKKLLGGINKMEPVTPTNMQHVSEQIPRFTSVDVVNCPDTKPPSIMCPENKTQVSDAGLNSTVVSWPPLIVNDNSGENVAVSCDHTSGSNFTLGTTLVKCVAVDAAQNQALCQFAMTVFKDVEPPTIICPEDITKPSDHGSKVATASWVYPTGYDNSGRIPAVSCNHTSGSTFSLGTTLIRCVATDGAENSAECHFSVNIVDLEAPTINCPGDYIEPANNGTDSAEVAWTFPMVHDNSGLGPNLACNHTSGSNYTLGTTVIKCTAVDAANNEAACQFSVIIEDLEPPSITCPANVNTRGPSEVVWPSLSVTDNSGLAPDVTCEPHSGSVFHGGISTVNCTATDSAMNSQRCEFEVNVKVDCQSKLQEGRNTSGKYKVIPEGFNERFRVYCDMETDGGGWTVFQKRFDGSVNFYRSWNEYQDGFGNLTGSEFWLGNEILHKMTLHGDWELRVDLGDWSTPMQTAYAHYDSFSIASSDTLYRLSLGSYSGTAGDSLGWHNNRNFFTHDKDTTDSDYFCAKDCHGAWWYTSCRHSNLNGPWGGPKMSDVDVEAFGSKCPELMNWYHFKGDWDSVKTTEMKIRRKF